MEIISIEIFKDGRNLKYIMKEYLEYYSKPPPHIFPIIEKEILIELLDILKKKLEQNIFTFRIEK